MNIKSSADEATYFAVAVLKNKDGILNDKWVSVNRDDKERVVSVDIVSGVENAISFVDKANAKSFCNTMRKLYTENSLAVMEVSIDF